MKYQDPLTKEYLSGKRLCEKYGISLSTFQKRYKENKSTLDAIFPVKDHLGNRYKSVPEMCKKHEIEIHLYYSRKQRGFSLEECLNKERIKCKTEYESVVSEKERTDHFGNIFPTKTKMCNFYGVSVPHFDHRIERGYTLEEALMGKEKNTIKGPNGKEYKNIYKMCEEYGISCETYRRRKKAGLSDEEALKSTSIYETSDHLGNKFPSCAEMLRYYNIKLITFRHRMKNGWTLEEALTIPPSKSNKHGKIGDKYEKL